MPPKKSTPVKNKPVINGDALDDAFAVLLRYAEFSGEKLNATHAATAADIAPRTAYGRIAKAKSEAKLNSTASCSSGYGVDAFKILLRYAEASGGKLQVPAAAKAAGIAARTAYAKVKNAREEMEAAAADAGGCIGHGSEEVEEDVETKKISTKKEPSKTGVTTRSGGKRKRSVSEDDDAADAEPIFKKEKVDEGIGMVDERDDEEEGSSAMTPKPTTITNTGEEGFSRSVEQVDTGLSQAATVENEDANANANVDVEPESKGSAEHIQSSTTTTTKTLDEATSTSTITEVKLNEAASNDDDDKDSTRVGDVKNERVEPEDEHWGAMMELETDDD